VTLGTLAGVMPASGTPGLRPYTLHIPVPSVWLNANQRVDLRRQTSDRVAWRHAAATYARQARIPLAIPAVHIVARYHFTDRRRRDVGNYYPTVKAVIDGLVDYGLVVDDDDTHVLGPDPRRGATVSKRPYPAGGLLVLVIRPLAYEITPEDVTL